MPTASILTTTSSGPGPSRSISATSMGRPGSRKTAARVRMERSFSLACSSVGGRLTELGDVARQRARDEPDLVVDEQAEAAQRLLLEGLFDRRSRPDSEGHIVAAAGIDDPPFGHLVGLA